MLVKTPAKKRHKNKQYKDNRAAKRKEKEKERLADLYLSLMNIKWQQ
jgi:hypothetical protein